MRTLLLLVPADIINVGFSLPMKLMWQWKWENIWSIWRSPRGTDLPVRNRLLDRLHLSAGGAREQTVPAHVTQCKTSFRRKTCEENQPPVGPSLGGVIAICGCPVLHCEIEAIAGFLSCVPFFRLISCLQTSQSVDIELIAKVKGGGRGIRLETMDMVVIRSMTSSAAALQDLEMEIGDES